MTRFARATGSKGSNERQPEEATSWQEMRKQMNEQKYQVQANEAGLRAFQQRNQITNAKPKENTWTEFELPKKDNVKSKNKNRNRNKNKKMKNKSSLPDQNDDKTKKQEEEKKNSLTVVDKSSSPIKEKKSPKKKVDVKGNEELLLSKSPQPNKKNSKKKNNNRKRKFNQTQNEENLKDSNEKITTQNTNEKITTQNTNGKITTQDTNEKITTQVPNKKINKNRPNFNAKKFGQSEKNMKTNTFDNKRNFGKFSKGNNKLGGKRKAELNGETRQWKKRKTEEAETIMFINGEQIPVVKYDGFQVQKKDAEALVELKNDLIAKGLKEEEINITMKLARRRAEKSLVRVRKSVCFQCRKSGHLLSDCPEIGINKNKDTMTGICYKCGSLEHSYLNCKVSKNSGFRFAECFICQEQGHIARECPDNPRGLYPKGGACKLCGDVTHFKKDCPTTVEEKKNNRIELPLLDDRNLESLEQNTQAPTSIESKSEIATKKIIKF